MKLRKQSSTSYPITFLMVDSEDHVTGKAGLTPTVTISKNGAAFGSPVGAVTEIGNGWYKLAGNATDRNTLGDFLVHSEAAGADPSDDRYCIVPWDPYDADSWGAGSGAVPLTYSLTSSLDGVPIPGVDVWATTDEAGTNVVARGVTDAFGQVVFYLDAGTYYFWRKLAGWTFSNPDTEVVS